jgi:hypothetical protein
MQVRRDRCGRWLPGLALLTAACTGNIGDTPAGSGPLEETTAPFVPAEPTIYRLTQRQLLNAYLDVLGDPLTLPTDLPPDDQLYGFTSIAAGSTTIAPLDAEQYETAAYDVLDQIWADPGRRDTLVGCAPADAADPCVRAFLEAFATRAWRRPVTSAEVDQLLDLAGELAVDLADTAAALRFAAAAVLQSPHFLFRVEIGEPDPQNPAGGRLRFTSWEMASRLSFLLTDGPPDEALLDAAARGDLTAVENLTWHAERMLEKPSARPALVRFFRDFMNVGRLDQLDKSADKFPQFSATLGPAMREEIERLFESVVFDELADFRQLFTTRETFVNHELAELYGIAIAADEESFVKVTLPDDGRRAGLLTSAGFLALNAHKTATSPTHRGRFVRISLLCQDVPPPPPGVDTTIPEFDPSQPTTLRQRLQAHRDNPQCRSCHERMDPIGFAFEHFDAIGAWRDDEEGLAIDTSTDLDGQPVSDAAGMGAMIAALPEASECIARRFYQHATAHLDKPGDEAAVKALVDGFVASNYQFKSLVVAMVLNDGFRYATSPGSEGEEVMP